MTVHLLQPLPPPTDAARLEIRVRDLETRLGGLEAAVPRDGGLCIVASSGDLDRLLATLNLAVGAASQGSPVSLFFTFWATSILRDPAKSAPKSWLGRMLSAFLPKRRSAKLSRMHWGGIGTLAMRWKMRKARIADLDELLAMCRELGVQIHACEMTMGLLELRREELIDYPGLELCGVATFLERASRAQTTMFI